MGYLRSFSRRWLDLHCTDSLNTSIKDYGDQQQIDQDDGPAKRYTTTYSNLNMLLISMNGTNIT